MRGIIWVGLVCLKIGNRGGGFYLQDWQFDSRFFTRKAGTNSKTWTSNLPFHFFFHELIYILVCFSTANPTSSITITCFCRNQFMSTTSMKRKLDGLVQISLPEFQYHRPCKAFLSWHSGLLLEEL